MPNIKLNIQINPQLSSLLCQLIPSCVFPHPCRNRKRQFRVSFAPTVNHTHRPPTAALRVCNLIMDQHSSRHAVMDSGASSHFFPTTYKGGDEQIDPVGVQVRTANNGVICSKLTDTIPFPILPPKQYYATSLITSVILYYMLENCAMLDTTFTLTAIMSKF